MAPGHPRSQLSDQFCNCLIGSVAVYFGHSGEEGSRVVDWPPPGGELDHMAREYAGQTWHTYTYFEGVLGLPGSAPGLFLHSTFNRKVIS